MTTTPRKPPASNRPTVIAVWGPSGGDGKTTETEINALLAAENGNSVLCVDLDTQCGLSRNFIGQHLGNVESNIKTCLDVPVAEPPIVLKSPNPNVDLLPGYPNDDRFFRLFPEHSTRLRETFRLIPNRYDFIWLDVPQHYENIAQLALIAADYLIIPIALSEDRFGRLPTVFRVIEESRAINPRLKVLGAVGLANEPKRRKVLRLSTQEHWVYRQYQEHFSIHDFGFFETIMFRSAADSVQDACAEASIRAMHYIPKRRFVALHAEIMAGIKRSKLSISQTKNAG